MHGLLLQKLSPDNGHLKYNLHYFIMLIGAISGLSQAEVIAELVKILGHYDSGTIYRWSRIKKGTKQAIPHEDIRTLVKYFNKYMPELELSTDMMLVETNQAEKRKYSMHEELPTAERLGLSKS